MTRLVILAILFFLGYTLYSVLRRNLGAGPSSPSSRKGSQGEEMVKDPQCGTYIPCSQALEKTIGGQTYYFCSPVCREKFRPPQ